MTQLLPFASGFRFPWLSGPRHLPHDLNTVSRILQRSENFQSQPDQSLQDAASELRRVVQRGTHCDDPKVVAEGFALVAEAARRTLRISYYHVQLLAGLALVRKSIAEMQTGEGKTFVAALPAFVHGLTGRGVHVMTVNSYLALRDYESLAPLFQMLGTTVGLLHEGASPDEKRAAYACDVTYGPGYEFGFDYLRDQAALLKQPKAALGQSYQNALRGKETKRYATIQRGHAFGVVDEIDSVLIDEATTPLVLSDLANPESRSSLGVLEADPRQMAKRIVEELTCGDYELERSAGKIRLTKQGNETIFSRLEQQSRSRLERPWPEYIEQALRAKWLLRRDVDYVVRDNQVQIVDQSTGRIMADRTWRHGLHQAVEAKEGLAITAEREPIARVSRQRCFRLYDGLCGMTGTATGSEREFWEFYRLKIAVIPLRKACQRRLLPARYFADTASKMRAVTAEVVRIHATGQPILIGTRTIEASERLSQQLAAHQVPHTLLNGKQDEEEAEIVAGAGQAGALTIATNMAGRGTDIRLGEGVVALGGLHVIGTEMHDSARIDRQLIGRAARQGDPGSAQFFVSAEDPFISLNAPSLKNRLRREANEHGEVTNDLSGEMQRLQRKVERMDYATRRQLVNHDHWLEDVLSKLAQ